MIMNRQLVCMSRHDKAKITTRQLLNVLVAMRLITSSIRLSSGKKD